MLAALGERDRELGGGVFGAVERRRVRWQGARVGAWSLLAGIAMTAAAALI